jgi:acyl carrier protein
MTKSEITEKVNQAILKVKKGALSAADLKPEASLRNNLSFDSLDLTELMILAERTFNMSINLEEAQKVETIEQMVAFIMQRQATA